VYGKGSLLSRQPGATALRFAGLRALLGHMWMHPGKKLLFMGGEFGQWREWNHDRGLDWHLLDQPGHRGVQAWVADLNALLRATPALYRHDFSARGFSWVEASDTLQSVFAYLRWGDGEEPPVLVVLNLTPVQRDNYRLGVPRHGYWRECLNSQAECYGGSGAGNFGGVESLPIPSHGHYHSLLLCLPPLSVLVLQPGKPS
jgi:1,4-alpha-glucan branching enzyme